MLFEGRSIHQIDKTRAAISGATTVIGGGAGFASGALIRSAGLSGARALAVGGAAWAADVGTGIAADHYLLGDSWGTAILGNALGFGLGEVAGYTAKGFARSAGRAGRFAGQVNRNVAAMMLGIPPSADGRGGKKTILELFSGPSSQINRSVVGYQKGEAQVLTIDIETYGNPDIIQGDATNLVNFDDDFVDEIFFTNPFNEGLREALPETRAQFKLAIYSEAARVLRPGGNLIISFSGNNSYAKILDGRGRLISELRQLGFELLPPTEAFRPNSPYGKLHPALRGSFFGRPDGDISRVMHEEDMRTLILRLGG